MKVLLSVMAAVVVSALVPAAASAATIVFSGVDYAPVQSANAAFSWAYDVDTTAPEECTLVRPSAPQLGPADCSTLFPGDFTMDGLNRNLSIASYAASEGTYTLTVDADIPVTQTEDWSLVVDNTAPTLTMSGPTGLTNDNTLDVLLSASDGQVRCAMDPAGAAPADVLTWPPCASGSRPPVADGPHNFRAAAVDSAENVSPVQTLSVTVDTTPPVIELLGISNGSVVPTPYPQYSLGSPDAVSLQCFYDNNPAITCASISVSTVGLGDGAHTMHVVATDLAGNTNTLVISFTANDSLPEGPIPNSVSLKTGKIKNAGSRIKVALAGSFTVSGNVNWATACTGRATIAMTGKVGRKTRTFRANAKLRRKGSSCTFSTTLTVPKAWKGKRQKTTITYAGNNQLGSFSVTGKLRLRQAR